MLAIRTQNQTLSAAQETALESLLGGATIAATARTLGVTRQTVSNWVNRDAVFMAAYQNRASDLRSAAEAKLEAALPTAIDTMFALLKHPDWRARYAAAAHLLRAVARPRPGQRACEVTAEEIESERALAALLANPLGL